MSSNSSDHRSSIQKSSNPAVTDSAPVLADLLASMGEAVISVDENQRIVFCNRAAEDIFGYAAAEVLGQPLDVLLPEAARDVHRRHVMEFSRAHQDHRHISEGPNVQGRRKDGAVFPTDTTVFESTQDGKKVLTVMLRDISRQRAAEAALRDSEYRFNALFNQAAVGVVLSAPDGRWLRVNQKLCDMLGYDESELMNLGFRPITHSEDIDSDLDLLARLKAGEIPFFTKEKRFIHKGGSTAWVFVTVSLVRNAEGEPDFFVTMIENIWRRARIREELCQTEERLTDAIESISEGFILFDADERLVVCNSTALKYYEEVADTLVPGVRFEEFARSMAESGLVSGAIGCEEAWIADQVAQFRNPSGPRDYALSDGRWIQLREYKTASGGRAGLRIDITESKRAEAALRKSEERYRELFEESPVAIWEEDWSPIKQMLDDLARQGVKDWRGYFHSHRDQLKTAYDLANVIEISLATVDLYRKESMEQLLEMSTAAVVIDDELDAFLEIVLAFLAGRMTFDIEAKDMAGDGSEIIVRRRVVIPPKHRGDWSRVIYAMEDVTERARAEGQLRQAQKMEAVGKLTGGVAHDFNNLLAVIQLSTQLLARKDGSDASLTGAILRATARGAELTQRLLAFSRLQPLAPQVIDLGALVSGTSEMLSRTLGETIEIKIATAPDLWTASADPGQVENALLNLALNARDAMPDGGKLTIECQNAHLDEAGAAREQEAVAGDYVVLAVSDTGSGMSAEVQARAFEPFFTTREVGQGSGLGLSMIYGFAQQSGGHVTIYSKEGRGTTVKLYLVRAEGASQPEETRQSADIPEGRGEVVLVIEDDDDVRAMAREVLEAIGYRVLAASDAARARSMLERGEKVGLVLSDVVLPGGTSGPEFAEEIRASHPDLPIIFMSGYPVEAAKHHGFLASDQVLLSKPFEMEQMAKALREALG